MSQDLWGYGWRMASDSNEYMTGQCAAWAVAHQHEYPHLRFGIDWQRLTPDHPDWDDEDDGDEIWQPQHIFTHDDTHAYDVRGAHPLDAVKQWDDVTLNHSLKDVLGTGMYESGYEPEPEHVRRNPPHTASRLAMPAPLPQGVTFHYHPTNDTIGDARVNGKKFWAPAVEARMGDQPVGHISWAHDPGYEGHGEVKMVRVHPELQRHGIATEIFDLAKAIDSDVHHSNTQTAAGGGWVDHEQSRNKKANTMTAAITVYTKPNCPQCVMTKKQLDKLGIDHQTVDVTADPDAHAYVTGLGYQSAPVVVVGDGEDHWSGFRPEQLRGLVE